MGGPGSGRRKPLEHHLRVGSYRRDRHPEIRFQQSPAVALDGPIPEPDLKLGAEGRRVWDMVHRTGCAWIGISDQPAVELACLLAESVEMARKHWTETLDPVHGRALAQLSREYSSALNKLGLTPASRAGLGVAVSRTAAQMDKLTAIRQRAANRKTAHSTRLNRTPPLPDDD